MFIINVIHHWYKKERRRKGFVMIRFDPFLTLQ